MQVKSLISIFRALNESGVEYLVVGGVAVNVHGYQRLTHDLDLVVRLNSANVLTAVSALQQLGYKPTVPVKAEELADASKRSQWIEQKNMTVFNLYSDQHPQTPLDIFVEEPFDYSQALEQAVYAELTPDLTVPFVGIHTLIEMKNSVQRHKDLDDIEKLKLVLRAQDHEAD